MMAARRVVMYSTGWCGYCERARAMLRYKGIVFEEIRLDERPGERAIMIERSAGRRTVPQIFVDDRHIGGAEEMLALERSGELDTLLGLET
jgi:glutaredoxin 3